jgi:tRNA 2-thiouridine synthesizing protein B
MATLHVLSHSPFADTRLPSCVRMLGPADGLLLSGDAVYALSPESTPWQMLQERLGGDRLFVLEEDMSARNIQAPAGVTAVDYAGFVALSVRFDRVNSWL